MPPILITGDLESENCDRRRFCDLDNLPQLITEPTRAPSNSLIDHIMTNIANNHVHVPSLSKPQMLPASVDSEVW